jgi:hypothetical protein
MTTIRDLKVSSASQGAKLNGAGAYRGLFAYSGYFSRGNRLPQRKCRPALGHRWRIETPKNRRTRGQQGGRITITRAGLGLRRTPIGPNANAGAILLTICAIKCCFFPAQNRHLRGGRAPTPRGADGCAVRRRSDPAVLN